MSLTIVTSYFGKLQQLQADGYVCIAIARYVPAYFNELHFPALSPSKALLFQIRHKYIDEAGYTDEFNKQLAELNPAEVEKALHIIAERRNNTKIALICYERPNQFCHRHIVANWLMQNTNLTNITEYGQ